MNEVELRDHVGDLLDGWTDCEMIGPNVESDAGFPDVSDDPEDPSTLITWGLGDEDPENENGFASTFGGTEIWRGSLLLQVWIEKDVGDKKQREHIRDLRRTFLKPSVADTTNFFIGSPRIADEFDSEAGYVGREIEFPYIRIDEQ